MKQYFAQILFFFIGIALIFLSGGSVSAQTSCLLFPSNSTAPANYGASWDVFDPAKALVIKSNCPTSGNSLSITVGRGNTAQYIWETSYLYNTAVTPARWDVIALTGTDGGNGWLTGSGTKTVTTPFTATASNPLYFVGYVCTNQAANWKCGCQNSACATNHWQLQAYTGIPPADDDPPPPTEFPPITSCGSTTSVTPSTLASNLGNGCKTLLLGQGTYSSVKIHGHSGGILTLRCQTPGTCRFQGGSEKNPTVKDSNGVVVDGILWENPGTGYFTIRNSTNVLVKNSTFRNMTSSGLLILDSASENIQLVGNTIHNDTNRTEQQLSDGSFDYTMDYGFRLYDAKSVYIANNTFTGGYNHAISFKSEVNYGVVANNRFSDCGRICMHVGQEPRTVNTGDNSVGEVLIKNNSFSATRGDAIGIMNVAKAILTGNTHSGKGTLYKVVTFYVGMNGCPNDCAGLVGNGTPANRQVIANDNS